MSENTNTQGTAAPSAYASNLQIDYQKEIYNMTKKQLAWQRFSTLCIFGIFLVVLVAAMIVLPKVNSTLTHADEVATNAVDTLGEIDKAVAEISESNANLNQLIEENSDPLSESVKRLSEVDYEGLNQAIADFQDAVGPMAAFFNKFK